LAHKKKENGVNLKKDNGKAFPCIWGRLDFILSVRQAGQGDPEAKVSISMEKRLGISRRGLTAGCLLHETSSSANTEFVLFGIIEKGIDEGITYPFPDVSVHIVKSPWVWELELDRVDPSYAVDQVPSMFMQFRRILSKIIICGRSSTAGVFPFNFSRKTELMVCWKASTLFSQNCQSFAKLNGIQPGNPVYG
jgi:hypothetical protein